MYFYQQNVHFSKCVCIPGKSELGIGGFSFSLSCLSVKDNLVLLFLSVLLDLCLNSPETDVAWID